MSKIFVYGSLKRGKSAHHFMERHNAVFLREDVTNTRYHIYKVGWFPGMGEDSMVVGGVVGEVYEVTDECLAALDQYEGAPELFRREEIELSNGDRVLAYLYNYSVVGCERFEEGLWQES